MLADAVSSTASTLYEFPPGFMWGCATASHQVEGDNHNDWTRWEATPGRIHQDQVSGRACEWWAGRYLEDFDRAASLNNNTHRFSLEWSRIEPEPGKFDDSALARYRDMLTALNVRNLRPMLTLNHFTLPIWFAESGGWLAEDAPARFERFARHVVGALADLCDLWCTLNEPMVLSTLGYISGVRPPGLKSFGAARRATTNQLRAHIAAYHAIKTIQSAASVGFTHSYIGFRPAGPLAYPAYRLTDGFYNMAFLNAFRDGAIRLPGARPVELPGAVGALDWVGLQYYMDYAAGYSLRAPGALFMAQRKPKGLPAGPGAWGGLRPGAIFDHIKRVWQVLNKPIIITEAGVPDPDDVIRPGYLAENIHGVWRAVGYNFPVLGYYVWSLLDNFEWLEGYDPRFSFGLYQVDFATQARAARPSAEFYREVCAENGLSRANTAKYAPNVVDKLFPTPATKPQDNIKLKTPRGESNG
jgi:beta-glucosidase